MKNMRSFLSSLLLIASILCGTSSAFAQGTSLGTIRGRVTDPTGAAVQNASVQVTDLETNSRVWIGQHKIKKYIDRPRLRV